MKKRNGKKAAAFLLSAILGAAQLQMAVFTSYGAEKPSYLKSVTYYSDDWVVNFWNSESSHMEEELARIAEDGFNSIILVIPWQEFQPQMAPTQYENYALEKLKKVMESAKRHGLWVVFRAGYTWDYGNGSGPKRFEKLLYDKTVRKAWLDYLKKLYDVGSTYDNFYGGFLTWEDFWNFVESAKKTGKSASSIKRAELIGYQDYVKEHYTLEELDNDYGLEAESYEDIWIPEAGESSFKIFYEYYDDFLNGILEESQQVFPGLSMEVRLDVDPVPGIDGKDAGISHRATYGCGAAAYTSAMYGINMRQEAGRKISAAEAKKSMKEELEEIKAQNSGKGIYIDQLLYTDNTPGFEDNARLADGQKSVFLEGLAPLLRDYTMGYGVWTYQNYGNNALYNSQFALGTAGWEFDKGCLVTERNGTKKAKIMAKSTISQEFGSRLGEGDIVKVCFTAETEGSAQVWVTVGRETKYVNITGEEDVYLEFLTRGSKITFSSDRETFIDDVNVYTFETNGELYGIDGREMELAPSIRILNQNL